MRKLALFLALWLPGVALPAAVPLALGPAIEKQRDLAAAEPANAALQNDLGNLLVLAGDEAGAEAAYRQALALDPARAATQFNLGLLLQARGERFAALRRYRAALDLDPRHAWARYQSGTIWAAWGIESLALRAYADALALEPRLGDPRFNPHLIDNPLATEAMLRAFRDDRPAGAQAPAVYDDVPRIASLLVYDTPPAAAPAAAVPGEAPRDPATAPPAAAHGRSKYEPAQETQPRAPGEAGEGGYIEVRVLDAGDLQPGAVSGQVIASPPGSSSPASPAPVPGSASPRAPRQPRPGPGVRTPPTTPPPASGGFVPSPISTGRLDLTVRPAERAG